MSCRSDGLTILILLRGHAQWESVTETATERVLVRPAEALEKNDGLADTEDPARILIRS